jgi:peptidoglycan hydrolase-like protein with peptidoglycan-binding domain
LLKKFLNSHLKLKIDLNNAFGPATQKAVMDFQLKYKDEILKPYAIKQPTGTAGKATANKINSLVCMQM